MRAKYPSLDLPATAHVDLMWHAHMLHTTAYDADCARLLGYRLLHEPWPDSSAAEDSAAFAQLDELWEREFGGPLHVVK